MKIAENSVPKNWVLLDEQTPPRVGDCWWNYRDERWEPYDGEMTFAEVFIRPVPPKTMRTIACHATRSDGSINYYRGPVGEKAEKAIRLLNQHMDEMFEFDPDVTDADVIAEQGGPPGECETEDKLIETLVWWANGCPDDDEDYEYVPEL